METRKLQHGELTRIIIGTVVASEKGITARELVAKLESWGIPTSPHRMSVRLAELAADGRIERVGRGRYEGV